MVTWVAFALFWLLPPAIGAAYIYLETPVAIGISIPAIIYWLGCLCLLAKKNK